MTFKSIIILSCFIANMEQDIFLDMFFAFFFAVSENLFTFAAIKGSHWRNLPKVLSRVAVFRDAATFVRKADFRLRSGDGSLIRPELRKETTKQNHKRVMRSGSWIQTTGPNNGHQLRDYSKSSNRSENRPLISKC